MESIVTVGADVHKDTNSVCMFDWNDSSFFAEAVIEPGVENMLRYIEKARKEYGLGRDCRFLIGYEAGPTGYGLCRGVMRRCLRWHLQLIHTGASMSLMTTMRGQESSQGPATASRES